MRNLLIFVFALSAIVTKGQPVNSLDSLLNSLNNNDLYVAPIIRGVCITIKNEKINKDTLHPQRLFRVSSLDEDIREVAKKYSENLLIEKLVALLQDPVRDLYANALLYDLLENRKLGKLLFMKREEWIKNGRKMCDTQYWQKYGQERSYVYSLFSLYSN